MHEWRSREKDSMTEHGAAKHRRLAGPSRPPHTRRRALDAGEEAKHPGPLGAAGVMARTEHGPQESCRIFCRCCRARSSRPEDPPKIGHPHTRARAQARAHRRGRLSRCRGRGTRKCFAGSCRCERRAGARRPRPWPARPPARRLAPARILVSPRRRAGEREPRAPDPPRREANCGTCPVNQGSIAAAIFSHPADNRAATPAAEAQICTPRRNLKRR